MSITSNPPKRRSGRRNDQIPFAVPPPSKGGGAGHNGEDAIPILLPNHVTEIHLAATGTVTLLETIPSSAYACAPVFLRNEGTAGNWLISFGGNTPGASSYSVKLGPGDSTLSTMGEGYKEANAPIGTIKAKHDNAGAGGAGVLSGFIAYNDGTSPLVGPTGAAGSTWRNGSGAPSNGLGSDGDYYLNTANSDVYVKAAGAYTVACNIKGATGTTGSAGSNGTNGTNGATWYEGSGAPSGGTGVDGDFYLDAAVASAGAIPTIKFNKPTHATTRSSTTLGSLGTPWTNTVTTDGTYTKVQYQVNISLQCAADEVLHAALVCAGTIIDRVVSYTAGAGNRENRIVFGGIFSPGGAGTYTFEVYVASNSGGAITVNSTVNTSTATSLTSDGVSSMQLRAVE
jgi:hypothetical protein